MRDVIKIKKWQLVRAKQSATELDLTGKEFLTVGKRGEHISARFEFCKHLADVGIEIIYALEIKIIVVFPEISGVFFVVDAVNEFTGHKCSGLDDDPSRRIQ